MSVPGDRRSVAVRLSVPIADARRGATVLAAVIALFGPTDPVRFVLTPTDRTLPSVEQVTQFGRLCDELAEPFGPLPDMTLMSEQDAARIPVLMSLTASGDPAADAKTVLVLGALGAKLGSALAQVGDVTASYSPRGGPDLIATAAAAARLRRSLLRPAPPARPVHLAVVVRYAHFWSAVQTVVDAGLRHPEVLLDVVLLDETSPEAAPRSVELACHLRERGIVVRDAAWLRASLPRLDVVLAPDGYDAVRPDDLGSRELAACGVRLVLVPYARALGAHPLTTWLLYNLPLHNLAWRIFAAGEGQRANYARYCEAGNAHVRCLGDPKRERLLTDVDARAAARRLRDRLGGRRAVLWNAHFESEAATSGFRKFLPAVRSYFTAHPEQALIARPHPHLLPGLQVRGGDAARSAAEFRAWCGAAPNVHLDESADAAAAMLAADVLISDLSSLIPEFTVLGRPIALLHPDGGLLVNDDRDCLDAVTSVRDGRGLAEFLDSPPPPTPDPTAAADLGSGARIVRAIVADLRAEERGAARDAALGAPEVAVA